MQNMGSTSFINLWPFEILLEESRLESTWGFTLVGGSTSVGASSAPLVGLFDCLKEHSRNNIKVAPSNFDCC